MIINYPNGEAFIKDNSSYLKENVFMSSFFFLDAPLLKESSKKNYALKVCLENKKLLVLKVEPYYVLLYGDVELVKELVVFIKENELEINGIYSSLEVGNEYTRLVDSLYNQKLYLQLGMDFMETKEYMEPSSKEVVTATLDDVDELYECLVNFVKDCSLNDEVTNSRVIFEDSKI